MDQFKQYKLVFDQAPEAIVLLDTGGVVFELNNRLEDWLNYRTDEVQGKHILDLPFFVEEDKPIIIKNIKKRLEGEDIPPYDLRFKKKDGEIRIGKIQGHIVRDQEEPIFDLVMINDITDERLASQELAEALDNQKLLANIGILLNSIGDFSEQVNEAIKLLGEKIQVGRVYIFENSQDGKAASNTYEWVNQGVSSEMNNLQNVQYADIASFRNMLSEDGIIRSNDIAELEEDVRSTLEPQNIQSILILPLFIQDKQIGFIGFDEVKKKREWSETEVQLLKIAANTISSAYERHLITKENENKISELENLNKIMVGRELKMTELKQEIEKLKEKE